MREVPSSLRQRQAQGGKGETRLSLPTLSPKGGACGQGARSEPQYALYLAGGVPAGCVDAYLHTRLQSFGPFIAHGEAEHQRTFHAFLNRCSTPSPLMGKWLVGRWFARLERGG